MAYYFDILSEPRLRASGRRCSSPQPASGVLGRGHRLTPGCRGTRLVATAGLTLPVYLSRVESGKSAPSGTAARALAVELGCAAWELVKDAEGRPRLTDGRNPPLRMYERRSIPQLVVVWRPSTVRRSDRHRDPSSWVK